MPPQLVTPDRERPTNQRPEQEVRIAMALNGGVSLAVWMGGCAVELDRARRAHAPVGEEPRVYDALCECFGRRLVLDILTGASAGGINGALLSAAMVKGRKLDVGFVRKQWLDLGALSDLLYPSAKEDPGALLDGELFHRRLRDAFEGVLGVNPTAPGYRECETPTEASRSVPSLDVTMTDVYGVEKRFQDSWGGELVAREHRPRFAFREPVHFDAAALADAARTSASFPIAFEPWRVKGNPRVLAGLPNPTYGIDGGLLDNAPIEAALALIPTKPASSRVLRYVCYLNGDPTPPSDDICGDGEPGLREVGGYVVNLPRTAPFVDQLYAIKRAVERPRLVASVQAELLRLDIGELSAVAEALFGTYVERRTMESLEELLGDPGEATAMKALLDTTGGRLPWMPFGLGSPLAGGWRWGLRPAQRILHLLLDLVRPRIPGSRGEERNALLGARDTIDAQLAALNEARDDFLTPPSHTDPTRFREEPPLDRLQKAAQRAIEQAPGTFEAIRKSAEALRSLAPGRPGAFDEDLAAALFDSPGADDWLDVFLRRVLSIEVIRRAFSTEAEIESAEELRFVQLTPAAPSPIFTTGPLRLASPDSARAKLAGIGLGHFAGFYRRSWRANDFMWGRLDAAARIVDLLLDHPSDEFGVGAAASTPKDRIAARAECLTEALLPEDPPEDLKPPLETRRWLLREALADVAAVIDGAAPGPNASEDPRPLVKERIEAELTAAGPDCGAEELPFTRVAFQRAAQLEIVAEELKEIREATAADIELGSAAEPFPASEDGTLEEEVSAVRELYEEGSSLPKRLTGEGEEVSDLGLRTITHATSVGLSALRQAGLPLSKFFGAVRAPLAAVAATVAENPLYRATAGLGFWAAAIYLATRLVTTEASAALQFSSVWSWATFVALVAALGSAGVAAVPLVRAWRKVHPLRNGLLAAGLLGTAFAFAAVLAWALGEFDIERILFAPGATTPPNLVILLPPILLGAVSAARLPVAAWLSPLSSVVEAVRKSRFMFVLLAASFALLGVWAGIDLAREGFDGGAFWQALGAGIALAGAPVVVAVSLVRWPLRP